MKEIKIIPKSCTECDYTSSCDSYYGGASYEIDIIGKSGSRVFSASLEDGVEVIGNIHDNPELVESEVKDERLY